MDNDTDKLLKKRKNSTDDKKKKSDNPVTEKDEVTDPVDTND